MPHSVLATRVPCGCDVLTYHALKKPYHTDYMRKVFLQCEPVDVLSGGKLS